MNDKTLRLIFKRLDASKIPSSVSDSIAFKFYYSQDISVLLAEIERLNKVIDYMKEDSK